MLARALFVAAELNIPEQLASQPLSVQELAAQTDSHPEALGRLLYFLELHKVFEKKEDRYYATPLSETMCASHPHSIKPFLLHDDPTRWNAFGNLGYSIRTGKASFDMLYSTDYFTYITEHPLLSERFNQAMTTISCQEDATLASVLKWHGTVADIGGGKGQLLNAITQKNAIEKTILVDLAEAIEQAQLIPPCEKIAGSFFEPLPLTADIFILKRILHDWDDEKTLLILKNVRTAMHTDARLYIIDGILDQAEDKKALAAIDLALLTIFQGRERTLEQFAALCDKAGLEIVHISPVNSLISALECKVKAQ